MKTKSYISNDFCPICNGKSVVTVFDLNSPFNGKAYRIKRCQKCNHQYALGDFSKEALCEVYGKSFHLTSQQSALSQKSPILLNAVSRAKWLARIGMSGKLLDVGAGRGYFVRAANLFFQAQGIDYSEYSDAYAKELGVKVSHGDFIKSNYRKDFFDVLTFWDVLAGMVSLSDTLTKAHSFLRKGGYLVFTVPMGDSMACKIAGKYWPLWIPPVNLHYFSKQSLETLINSNGFELVMMQTKSKSVSFNFLMFKLARTFGLVKLGLFFEGLPATFSIPINLGDINTIVVRKV